MTILLNILFIVTFKWGYKGLIYSNVIANFVITIFIFIRLNIFQYISLKKKKKNELKDMIKYSIPLVPNSISWAIINLSNRLVISGFIGTSANGIYSMANKFPSFMDTIYGFFYTAWKESAAKALKEDDNQAFYKNIYNILKKLLYSVTVGMIACLPFVFGILIKQDFSEAYQYIPVLLISMFFSNISGFYGGIFSAYKYTKIMGTTTILSAIINLLLNIVLIKVLGIWAATISSITSTFIVYILRKRKINEFVKFDEKINFISVVIIAICIATYYINNTYIHLINLLIVVLYCTYLNKDIIILVRDNVIKKLRGMKK